MVIAINIIALSLIILAVITFFKTVIKIVIVFSIILAIIGGLWYFGIIGSSIDIKKIKNSTKSKIENSSQKIKDIVR